MGSLGWQELVIVLVIVVIIFGVGRLPEIGGALGKSVREFKSNTDDTKGEITPGTTTTTTYKATDSRPTETREVRADEI